MTVPRALVYILVLSVAVRLGAFAISVDRVGYHALIKGDALGYVELAGNIANGKGFMAVSQGVEMPHTFRTPGLPILIAPFTTFDGGLEIYSLVLAIAAGIGLPLFLYLIARRFIRDRAALLAAALLALEPHAVTYSFLLQSEVPFMLFALGGFLAALLAHEQSSYWRAILGGALLGFSVLIRPGYLSIFLLAIVVVGVTLWIAKDIRYRQVAVVFVALVATLTPWIIRNHAVTGVYALSGMGWRNVYTDYVSSIRSLENGTPYHEEKEKLKNDALPNLGISRADIGNPAHAPVLRAAALREMWAHKVTVIKLEIALLASFFIQDGYYYHLRNLGFVREDVSGEHISPTAELLKHGVSAFPAIFEELSRQKFIPIIGRMFTVGILISAIAGFFLMRGRMRFLFVGVIALTALFSTAIGLGLDARMRVPVEPLLFIFASVALVYAYDHIRR